MRGDARARNVRDRDAHHVLAGRRHAAEARHDGVGRGGDDGRRVVSPASSYTSPFTTVSRACDVATFAGLRTSATTSWPSASAALTTSEPTLPAAPGVRWCG